jgi:hypothetical protein
MTTTKDIVLLSGGQDSTTCLYVALKTTPAEEILALSFDYGQRHRVELPFVPVLQGFTHWDYLECAERYLRAGVDLAREPLIGVGTMCRRQGTDEAEVILRSLSDLGLRLHAFGAKTTGLKKYASAIVSSDSLAWSFNARRHPPLPGCTHKNCNSCPKWALRWRERLLAQVLFAPPDVERNAWPGTMVTRKKS